MAENKTISLQKYLSLPKGNGRFVIPDFQRGYVWGKSRKQNRKNSVEFLLDSLLDGYGRSADIFLQGITYTRLSEEDSVVIIDGQQRTTFFYLLLKFLKYDGRFELCYAVRDESNRFLAELDVEKCKVEDHECEYQDVFFFQRTLRIFHEVLSREKIEDQPFLTYLLNHVKFLCIHIQPDKAETIFTMMNGNKAEMKQEELIKAELLRRASLPSEAIKEVESRDIRGRMAREWDEWLHWWQRDEVKDFFCSDGRLLGWLLPLYLGNEAVTFEAFRRKLDKLPANRIKEAKEVFRLLRLKQRQLQDVYSNPVVYNYVGAILRMKKRDEDRFTFLRWYFNTEELTESHSKLIKLRRYFDLTVIGCNHSEIIGDNRNKIDDMINEFHEKLGSEDVYRNLYEDGCRWLLRCNVLQDCIHDEGRGRKFNFKIWNNRSLEHIYPKSKFGHYMTERPDVCLSHDDKEVDAGNCEIFRGMPGDEDYVNEHSIGNLVLLYGKDNSAFGAKDFQNKKDDFFNVGENNRHFESRHLIHTISVFAKSQWTRNEIISRCKKEVDDFESAYSIYKTDQIAESDGKA